MIDRLRSIPCLVVSGGSRQTVGLADLGFRRVTVSISCAAVVLNLASVRKLTTTTRKAIRRCKGTQHSVYHYRISEISRQTFA
jgi:hypothetical protein